MQESELELNFNLMFNLIDKKFYYKRIYNIMDKIILYLI